MRTTANKAHGDEAFTLIEVLVAMALMAVVLLAVFKLQAQNLDLLAVTNSMTAESYLAHGRLARIGAHQKLEPGERSGEIRETPPPLHYREEISAQESPKGFYRVKVEIWGEGKGAREPAAFETYLYRREP